MNQMVYAERIENWRQIIAECENSGKTATAWCKENGYTRDQYKYWKRKIRDFDTGKTGHSRRKKDPKPVLKVQRGDIHLHFYQDADPVFVTEIISALLNHDDNR